MNSSVNRTLAILGCGVVLAGGMIGSAFALSRFMIKIQQENTILTKGLAEKTILADTGAMECRVGVSGETLEEGYKKLLTHYIQLKKRLLEAGFKPEELEESPLSYREEYKTVRANGREYQEFSHFRFTRSLRIVSQQVDLVHKQSMELPSLLIEGIELSLDRPEYYVSDLEKYKLELIAEATDSAMKRAEVTAAKFGSRVGRLITARNGIIQITRPASSDMSDYGYYDTTSREKVMKIVVSATFEAAR